MRAEIKKTICLNVKERPASFHYNSHHYIHHTQQCRLTLPVEVVGQGRLLLSAVQPRRKIQECRQSLWGNSLREELIEESEELIEESEELKRNNDRREEVMKGEEERGNVEGES